MGDEQYLVSVGHRKKKPISSPQNFTGVYDNNPSKTFDAATYSAERPKEIINTTTLPQIPTINKMQ